jgi:hypothetical protein
MRSPEGREKLQSQESKGKGTAGDKNLDSRQGLVFHSWYSITL